jgi:hypothetical protein
MRLVWRGNALRISHLLRFALRRPNGGTRLDRDGVWRRHATQQALDKEKTMIKTNEGSLDRALRVAAGLALIGLSATGTVGMWGYIGVVPLLTGAIGWCPLYTLLGINTCPMRR